MAEDVELLRQYAETGSEDAFTELVNRHLPLVYSAAVRQAGGDEDLAKDIAQSVFIDLARKAGSLVNRELLAGWLYCSTRLAASKMVRTERRRRQREGLVQAMQENDVSPSPDENAGELRLVLDEAMSELDSADCNAVLLRFFQSKTLREVGSALGISEDAARMRVNRSLDKLHGLLTLRGVTLSVTALGATLAVEGVSAAPPGLALSISAAALAKAAVSGSVVAAGAAGTTSTTTLTLLKIMASIKLKVGLAALLAAAVATPLYIEHRTNQELVIKNGQLQMEVQRLAAASATPPPPVIAAAPVNNADSRELLRLRGQVGLLRRELAASDALAKSREPLSEILKTLSDPDPGTEGDSRRFAAAQKLRALGPAALEALPKFKELLQNENYDTALAGAQALAQVSEMSPEALQFLTNALIDSNPQVRVAAMHGVGIWFYHDFDKFSAQSDLVVPALIQNLSERGGDVTSSASQILGRYVEFHKELGQPPPAPETILPALVQSLGAPDKYTRIESARAIGEYGEQGKLAQAQLEALLNDADAEVHGVAQSALQKIAPQATAGAR